MKQLISYFFTLLMFSCIISDSQLNYKLNKGSKRKLEESKPNITSLSWEPIRIHYEFLNSDFNPKSVSFLSSVLDIATIYFQKHLLVLRTNQKLTYKSNYPKKILGFSISQELQDKEYDADLVLFINIEYNFFASYLAYCGPAIFDEQTLRPIFGLISWNMYYSPSDPISNSIFEVNVEIAIHEIIHGLGFIDDYFFAYYDSYTGKSYNTSNYQDSYKAIYLTTPRVINLVQYHFNCTTLVGLQMEDNGGSGTRGSHLERTLFYNEIMTGSDITGNFLITDFTFELLQDTGFYRVADYSPDQSIWGKNKGCNFANKQCEGGNFTEFCTKDQPQSCSFYKTGVSNCRSESLSGYCSYYYIASNYDCRDPDNIEFQKDSGLIQHFGSDSICISGSVSKEKIYKDHSCIQYKCDLNNKLSLVIEGQEFDCSKDEETIKLPESYNGNITCPSNSKEFCQNRDECPNLCSKKGFCQNKECICMKGYSSKDCSVECTKYRYKGTCLDKCPNSTYVYEDIKYCIGCPANCLTCTNYNKCTSCKKGYILRGDFCDNFDLIKLLTEVISDQNTTSTNTTNPSTNSTDTSTNSTDTSTNSTDTSTNSTDTSTNSTDTSTNSTDTSTNSTDTETNSTDTETNSTDTETNATDTETNSTDTETNSTDTETNSTDTETNSTDTNNPENTTCPFKPQKNETKNTPTQNCTCNTANNEAQITNSYEELIYLINIFMLAHF